jgi:hypothetical protein
LEVTGALVSLDIGVVALHGPVYSAPSALTAKWDGASWGMRRNVLGMGTSTR